MLEIDGKFQLVLVGNDIMAEAGQYLTMVGGVVIGVYTGKLPHREPFTGDTPEPPRLAITAPAKGVKQPTIGRPSSNTLLDTLTTVMIFDTIKAMGGKALTEHIGDWLNVPKADAKSRQKIWRLMSVLVEAGQLARSRGPNGGYYEYKLTPHAASSGALLPPDALRTSQRKQGTRPRVAA